MKLHTLLLAGAAAIALAGCQPKSETDGAAPAVPPPPADIAAPTPQSGPAAPNSTDTLASAPPAATPPAATPAPAPAAPPAATPPAAAPKVSAAAAATTPAELTSGRAIFARSCVMCHGPTGGGASIGPEIKLRDLAAIRDKLTRGTIKPDDKMPPMSTMGLSASDISDVAKFVAAGLPQ